MRSPWRKGLNPPQPPLSKGVPCLPAGRQVKTGDKLKSPGVGRFMNRPYKLEHDLSNKNKALSYLSFN